jgi:hypothetical protein
MSKFLSSELKNSKGIDWNTNRIKAKGMLSSTGMYPERANQ